MLDAMSSGAGEAEVRPHSIGEWRDYGEPELPVPLAAALAAFAEQGYHGTSVREIASRANLSVPGLYHHYPSKQSLLQGLLERTMTDLLSRSERAIAEAGDRPVDQFDAVVESLLRFHMYRREQAFVGSTEIRSLDDSYRQTYIGHRDRQQHMVDEVVFAGVEAGVFSTRYPKDASRAVATMCVGVSTWFKLDGELGADELISRNLQLARALVGYRTDVGSG
ncbi:TetR/AcrR family transcriptional regulator [Gordonia hankookensis]|uniref:TetR/AcrR family transcriptional regulator n=1 Tax=Gordonia hankookensis TaxID=589403 RepID=A0ABR7WDW2_9ACTN|nr:TetR/AcrR family transcriptional regulator [Gordonia hankookensis]MBD1319992.1 TetR/AcrR family transcriptional regulator [Gordonia hankookensis]NDZ95347.1 TetR/AcrR family transcriptional regulator [Streptomyces sp. SID11726]NEB24501.1 TetR/AcrR family transcriptional regulator [Streptomyces sp. SID6673]